MKNLAEQGEATAEARDPASRLSVDLDYLTKAGAELMPAVAAIHAEATARVHESARSDHLVFRTPGTGGARKSPAWEYFQELRDMVQRITRETAVNVDDAGMGLLRVVELYGGADAENVERFPVPEAPAPGDPLPVEGEI